MTHMSVAGSALEVPDDLVRLSVGIEDVEDLVEDLRTALDAALTDRLRPAGLSSWRARRARLGRLRRRGAGSGTTMSPGAMQPPTSS